MKQWIACMLALAMVFSLAACGSKAETAPAEEPQEQTEQQPEQTEPETPPEEEAAEPEVPVDNEAAQETGDPQPFIGIWSCDRATVQISARPEGGYRCYIHWGGSATEAAVWEYQCLYGKGLLYDNGDGVKSIITWDESGNEIGNETVYTDGSARFELTEDGGLVWTDDKEQSGEGMVFTHEDIPVPSTEQLVEQYFHVIGGYEPGVAGSSISEALSAYASVQFASDCALWAVDTDALRASLLTTWEGLSQEEQSHFDANFIDVVMLIDRCVEDWGSNKGSFEDGGVAEDMARLLQDDYAMSSWYVLRDFTLTMGNSED